MQSVIHLSAPRGLRRALSAAWLLLVISPACVGTQADEYRRFFDELFAKTMVDHDIPGLAISVVKGDEIVFRAGYGWADLERQTAVDPDRTLFRLGSISKLLTGLAVMQLVERRALDLDTDIARYIAPIQVDQRFRDPVTLRHLLTHTDGFDVRWLFGGAAPTAGQVLPLERLLAHLPPRVASPGELYLYSDVGMAVAGHAVERVSHLPFSDYVERHILQPLGMQRTTFRPPGSGAFWADLATGYDYDRDGALRPAPIAYPHAVPACGLTGTVSDLGDFMIALLQDGGTGQRSILGREMLRELGRRQFSQHAGVPGTSYGLYEYVYNGRRGLAHGGLMLGFTTVLYLLPEERVGLCVAANRFDLVALLEDDLLRQFLDHFYPAAPAPAPLLPAAGAPSRRLDLTRFAGTYRCDQYSRFSIDKLFVLAGLAREIRVEARSDGRLVFQPDGSFWREVKPGLFENERTGERVAFRTDEHGRATRIVGSAQFMSYHRLGFLDRVPAQLAMTGGLTLASSAGAIAALWAWSRSRLRSGTTPSGGTRVARLVAIAVGTMPVLLFILLGVGLGRLDFTAVAFGEPPLIAAFRGLAAVVGVMAIVQMALVLTARRSLGTARWEAPTYGMAGAATFLLTVVLAHWNLVRLPFTS